MTELDTKKERVQTEQAKTARTSRASGVMGTPSIQPTSYTEVSRIHRGALATLKGSVVLTSAVEGEGVSLLAHLMAQRSAESGKRTLLIDLSMRNTDLTNKIMPDRTAWNLNGRDFKDGFGDLIHPVNSVDKLFFMPAPLDSASIQYLKDMQHAAAFFEALEKEFEHVVVDTTPVGSMNRYNIDPVILSAASRRSLIVMMAARTPKDKIYKAIKQMRESGANIEGVVVNDLVNPSLRNQLLALADFFKKVSPSFTAWMRGKILKSEI